MPVRTDGRVPGSAPMSFGARLRHERERRQISIASIAESTKILGALLEGLENNDVSRWPTGLYRRAFMRAYANAIGLDAEATVKEFLERFPDAESSQALATSPPAPVLPAWAPAPSTPKPPPVSSAATSPAGGEDRMLLATTIRIGAPRLGTWFSNGVLVRGFRLRCVAAAIDLFVVSVLGLACYAVLGQLWAPLSIAAAAYYAGGVLLLGNTPGVCLFADPDRILKSTSRIYLKLVGARAQRAKHEAHQTHGGHGDEASASSPSY